MSEPITEDELDRLTDGHRPVPIQPTTCARCSQTYPCITLRIVEQLREARQAIEYRERVIIDAAKSAASIRNALTAILPI